MKKKRNRVLDSIFETLSQELIEDSIAALSAKGPVTEESKKKLHKELNPENIRALFKTCLMQTLYFSKMGEAFDKMEHPQGSDKLTNKNGETLN